MYDAAMRNVLHVSGSAVKAGLCLECCIQTWSPAVRKDELKLDEAQRKSIRPFFLPITLSSDWKSLVSQTGKVKTVRLLYIHISAKGKH